MEFFELLSIQDNQTRELLVSAVDDPIVRKEWETFEAESLPRRKDNVNSSLARIMKLCLNPTLRRIFSQRKRALDFQQVIRDNKIVLVNLEKYKPLRPDRVKDLGTLLVNDILAAVYARPVEERRPVYLFIDEFENFATKDICTIMREGRSFQLHLILAHQDFKQVFVKDEEVYHELMTNVRTKIIFGGLPDEELNIITPELFTPEIDPYKVKDEITSLELEPVETTRETISVTQNWNTTGGITQSVTKSENQSLTKQSTVTKTKGKATTTTNGESTHNSRTTSSGFSSGESETSGENPSSTRSRSSNNQESVTKGSSKTSSLAKTLSSALSIAKGIAETTGIGTSLGKAMTRTIATGGSITTTRVPFYEYIKRRKVSSREFQTVEEQLFEKKKILKSLEKRHYIIKNANPKSPATLLKTTTIEECKISKERLNTCRQTIFTSNAYYSVESEIQEEIGEWEETKNKAYKKLKMLDYPKKFRE
jgi:hypothetical protein